MGNVTQPKCWGSSAVLTPLSSSVVLEYIRSEHTHTHKFFHTWTQSSSANMYSIINVTNILLSGMSNSSDVSAIFCLTGLFSGALLTWFVQNVPRTAFCSKTGLTFDRHKDAGAQPVCHAAPLKWEVFCCETNYGRANEDTQSPYLSLRLSEDLLALRETNQRASKKPGICEP